MAGEILRPYAINTGSTISGTTQVGDIAIGENDTYDYSTRPGGVTWYMGPDENLGYLYILRKVVLVIQDGLQNN